MVSASAANTVTTGWRVQELREGSPSDGRVTVVKQTIEETQTSETDEESHSCETDGNSRGCELRYLLPSSFVKLCMWRYLENKSIEIKG